MNDISSPTTHALSIGMPSVMRQTAPEKASSPYTAQDFQAEAIFKALRLSAGFPSPLCRVPLTSYNPRTPSSCVSPVTRSSSLKEA